MVMSGSSQTSKAFGGRSPRLAERRCYMRLQSTITILCFNSSKACTGGGKRPMIVKPRPPRQVSLVWAVEGSTTWIHSPEKRLYTAPRRRIDRQISNFGLTSLFSPIASSMGSACESFKVEILPFCQLGWWTVSISGQLSLPTYSNPS